MQRIILDAALPAARGFSNEPIFSFTEGDMDAHTIRARVFSDMANLVEIDYFALSEAVFAFTHDGTLLAALPASISTDGLECDLTAACTRAPGEIRCLIRVNDEASGYTLASFACYVHPNPLKGISPPWPAEGDILADATAAAHDVILGKIAYGSREDNPSGRVEGTFFAGEPLRSGRSLHKACSRISLSDGETLMLLPGQGDFRKLASFTFVFIGVEGDYVGGFVDGALHRVDSVCCEGLIPDGLHFYANDSAAYFENLTGGSVALTLDALGVRN